MPANLSHEILDDEMYEWRRRQNEKENNYHEIRSELRDLSRMVKDKEQEH